MFPPFFHFTVSQQTCQTLHRQSVWAIYEGYIGTHRDLKIWEHDILQVTANNDVCEQVDDNRVQLGYVWIALDDLFVLLITEPLAL